MADNNLFSKEAMAKLRSPDRLDTLLEVTNPVGWMLLAAIILILLSVLAWSIFGAMVVKVDGVGVLLDSGGIASVASISGGKVKELYVSTGTKVKKGEVIATLEQPSKNMETKLARSDAYLAENNHDALARVAEYDAKRYQQEANELVVSDYDGIVDEVAVIKGGIVSAGTPLCTIRRDQSRDDITGIFYVPVSSGKRIQPGMTIQLAPNGVNVSEDGSLLAVVRSVSQYPVSSSAMLSRLGNAQLVQWILHKDDNAVVEVYFDLVKDSSSESGYLWTSVVGKHKPVTVGSICGGSIVVDRKPPIEKVFYKFSQMLRSR